MDSVLACQCRTPCWSQNVGQTGARLRMDRFGSGLETMPRDPTPVRNLSSDATPTFHQRTPQFTPIPNQIMSNVALDLFRLPPVVHDGKNSDTIAVCVDRLSGWMVVVPLLDKGLTGEEIAQKMVEHWAPFGMPSIVKTDQGSHFTPASWTTMCASLGIR